MSAMMEDCPWAMLANGPAWTMAGVPSRVCIRLGLIASFMRTVSAPATPSAAPVTEGSGELAATGPSNARWLGALGGALLLFGGLGLAALGFAYGIPAALVYHWLLHRSLSRSGRLPARWWISPTSHHALVPPDERPSVFAWAALGGSGFVIIVIGIVLTALGLWRAQSA